MQKKTGYWMAGAVAVAALAAAAALALVPHRHPADRNGDGRIVAAEIDEAARQRFAEHDANRDGRLTGEELPRRHGRRRHRGHHGDEPDRAPAPAASPQAAPAPAAQPQSGPAAAAIPPPPPPGRPPVDADGDGAVDFAEFRAHFAQRLGRADANRDGTIDEAELAASRERRGRRRH